MKECTVEIYRHGNRYWLNKEGELHREDGPAFEGADGYKAWWLNNKRHREDGPAIESVNGNKWWYLNDKRLTEAEFNNRIKNPCSGKIVEIEGVKYRLVEVSNET